MSDPETEVPQGGTQTEARPEPTPAAAKKLHWRTRQKLEQQAAAASAPSKPQQVPTDVQTLLNQIIKDLPPEKLEELEEQGYLFPIFEKDSDVTKSEWGYRCSHCDSVALEFTGTSWRDLAGNKVLQPPLAVPLARIPWRAYRQGSEPINRAEPACWACGAELALEGDGSLRQKQVVNIPRYLASREASLRESRALPRSGGLPAQTFPGMEGQAIVTRDGGLKQAIESATYMAPEHRAALQTLVDRYSLTAQHLALPGARV